MVLRESAQSAGNLYCNISFIQGIKPITYVSYTFIIPGFCCNIKIHIDIQEYTLTGFFFIIWKGEKNFITFDPLYQKCLENIQ